MSFTSSNSSGGNNNMDPPPNQQPRQPPSGGNGHRKSSSLNRGWFGGTMEVISGMAPRPVTPSQNQHTRSASAPNSPARGIGMGLFGGGGRSSPHHHFPPQIDRTNSGGSAGGGGFALPNFPINRLPSQDSLDRSIHNESGHGKSTAQIIRDLKHSNSALSAKMASLEKRHMNELAQVGAASSSKRQELEQISAKQKMKLMQYEQYKAAAESKMKQQDAELSKVKEESAFQRHSISDLKNQLYQLQQELDERDEEVENRLEDDKHDDGDDTDDHDLRRPHSDDRHSLPLHPGYSRGNNGLDIAPSSSSMSTEELQQMSLDNEEFVKEIQELQDQLMEYQGYDKKLKDLQRQLEAAQKVSTGNDVGIPPRPTTPTHTHVKNQPERERPPLVPSKSRDQDEAPSVSPSDLYRKQLQDAKEELEAQTLKLYQRESSLQDLEAEKESLTVAHSRRVQELEDRFVAFEEESKNRELALRKELTSFSQQEIDQTETRLRGEQQQQVVELEEQLEQYAEKLAEVAATLAESRQQAKNQEQYRKDEAEDLRMIQDAHEAEIVRLEKELDEATKELELRDEELEEVKQKDLSLLQQEKEGEKEFDERDTEGTLTRADDKETGSVEELTSVIPVPKNDSNSKLVSNLEEQLYSSVDSVNKLEIQLESLRKEHSEVVAKLEMEKTELSNDLKIARGTPFDVQMAKSEDSPGLHRYWEEKTSKTKEVEILKDEIESMRQRVYESTETGKLAEQKVQDLEIQLKRFRTEEKVSDSKEISEESKFVETRLVESEEQITRLKKKIEELNNLSVENKSVKKELQDAQSALVALDDDKQAMYDELNELVSSLEKEKKIQTEMTTQLDTQEEELVELQNIRSLLKSLEAEKLRLQDEVEQLKNDNNHNTTGDSPDISSPQASSSEADDVRQNFERQIEDLSEEKSLIKTKLKDRDTTIATLLRSSIVLENKIEALQAERHESRAKAEKTIEELQKLRSTQVSMEEEYSKIGMEMKYLKGQLKIVRVDAKRWKRALKEDGTTSGEYRYQVAMLQKSKDDFAETVQERDQAIQNLVNQSIGQESHVRDLKIRISSLMKEVELVRMNQGRNNEGELKAEIDRLQEESEIFAGQIIEQDEEFKRMQGVLIQREEQIALMKTEVESFNQRNKFPDNSILQNRDRQISELHNKLESLECQRSSNANLVDPVEMKNLQAELDEIQEAAESNRVEIRDLRRQLWEAKDAAGSASDLRVQLEQVSWEFNEYKRNNAPEKLFNDDSESRIDVDKAIARIKELEVILTENTVTETKLNDLKTELEGRERVIKELKEQLSKVCTTSEEVDSLGKTEKLEEGARQLKNKNNDLESQLQSKLDELENLTEQLDASQSDMDGLRELLQSKEDAMEELREQTKVSQNEISALQDEAVSLRKNLDGKTERIDKLKDDASILARDIDIAKQNLQVKTKSIDYLEQQLKANKIKLEEASDLKAKVGDELADSQARLGALEKELLGAITETSSNEDLSRKNQSLVQENASLVHKNESLVQENASLGNMNDNLVEESATLTNDNQILCEELKALVDGKSMREFELKSLTAKIQSLDEQNHDYDERVTSLTENVDALNKCNDTLHRNIEVLTKDNENLLCQNNDSLKDRKDAVADHYALQQKVEDLGQVNDSLANKNIFIIEESKGLVNTIENLKEKNQTLVINGVRMEESIESLKADMEKLSKEASELEQLKIQLHESEVPRESFEKTIIEKYEKQFQSLSSSKDAEIDILRNKLTESRELSSENIGEVVAQLKITEEENIALRDQFEFEMQAKNQQIFALEHTLHAQEQIVETMRSEMDQIQSGMEHATQTRRNEVEEMQQEVMQIEGKAMKQEREIVALKMQLEERKLEHKADVVKLKDALAQAMEDSPLKQTISSLQNNDRMLEVRERLEQLKARNTDLQEENLNLGGRLERAAIQINAFEVEKQQAEEIEEENMKLRNQLKEYEQLLSRSSKSARNAPLPRTSNSSPSDTKEKKKKKFGLFKRRNVDGSISEGKEEEEC